MRPVKRKPEPQKCTICKEPLPAIRRRDKVYCSPACRVRGWALRLEDDRREGERRETERPESPGRRAKDAA